MLFLEGKRWIFLPACVQLRRPFLWLSVATAEQITMKIGKGRARTRGQPTQIRASGQVWSSRSCYYKMTPVAAKMKFTY